MDNSIWKSPDGKFFQVADPTMREVAILTVWGFSDFKVPKNLSTPLMLNYSVKT